MLDVVFLLKAIFASRPTNVWCTCPRRRACPIVFVSLVEKYSHKQTDTLESIVRPWLEQENTVAAAMSKKLPDGQTMSAHQRRIIVARPMPRVLKVPETTYVALTVDIIWSTCLTFWSVFLNQTA